MVSIVMALSWCWPFSTTRFPLARIPVHVSKSEQLLELFAFLPLLKVVTKRRPSRPKNARLSFRVAVCVPAIETLSQTAGERTPSTHCAFLLGIVGKGTVAPLAVRG